MRTFGPAFFVVGFWVFMADVATPVSAHAGSSVEQERSVPPSTGHRDSLDDPDASSSGSVLVVPFINVSGNEEDDWIGDGIAETLMSDLEGLGSLRVVAQARVHAATNRRGAMDLDDSTVMALGRELGSRWVVTGGYQRVGRQLRITARLMDVGSGLVVKAAKVDGTLEAIFTLQDQIVLELASGLGLGTGAQLTSGTTPRPLGTGSNGEGGEGILAGVGGGDDNGGDNGAGTFGVPPSSVVAGGIVLPSPNTANNPPGGVPGTVVPAGVLTGRPRVTAVRAEEPPRIDGQLDDQIWQRATRLSGFVQVRPLDGAPATEETEIWVAFDSRNLYFAMHAHYTDPRIARTNRVDRDQTRNDDTIALYFDTFLDQQRTYVLSVNGYGVQADSLSGPRGSGGGGGRRSSGGGGFRGSYSGVPRGDPSWDALFDSAGTPVADGWTAEMAIPFKSLRYPSRDTHRWGFQVVRSIGGKDETDVWSPVSRDNPSFMSQMGLLEGLNGLSTSRNVEFLPTVTAVQVGSLDTNHGGFSEARQPEGGLNVKYGVTSNMTLDLTYNPDFSQIESDRPQIEVNQRYPLFFSELRPFFLEGQEVFRTQGPANLLHTRTIVDPRYGGKLTGKVGKTTIGLLFANDEAPGKVSDLSDPAFGRTAQFLVGRVRYDMYSESYIGAVVTSRDFLDQHSRVGGFDGNFRFGRTQSVSMSYFQSQHRDDKGVELSGPGWSLDYNNRGRHLTYSVDVEGLDPDFRTNTGFVRRVDTRRAQTRISYRWYPETWLINWGPRTNYSRNYDFAGILQDERTSAGLSATFAKNINLSLNVNRDMERYGGINFFKSGYSLFGGVNTSRKIGVGGFLRWGEEVRYGSTPFIGNGVRGNVSIFFRPVARFQHELNVSTSRLLDPSTMQEVFDVKIYRTFSTYQLTDRILFRNIMEFNTFNRTLGANLLFTYRVNAGTVFFIGYDDRYRQGNMILDDDDEPLFYTTYFERTNRAFFTKMSYLFRF